MVTKTLSKNLIKNDNWVVIPRKEYEEFYEWKETARLFKTFAPTAAQKRDLKKARDDYKQKKYLTLNEFKRRLAVKN